MARVQIPDDFSFSGMAKQDYAAKVEDALARGATTDEVYSLARTADQRAIIDEMVQRPTQGGSEPGYGQEFDQRATRPIEGDQSFLEPINDPAAVLMPDLEEIEPQGERVEKQDLRQPPETSQPQGLQPQSRVADTLKKHEVQMPPQETGGGVMFPPEPDTSGVQFPQGMFPQVAPEVSEEDLRQDNPFFKNLAMSFGSGSNAALKTLAGLYGAVSGDIKDPNSVASRLVEQAESGMGYYGDRKSDYLKALEEARSKKVASTDNEWKKMGYAVWETVSSANLLANMLVEQVPSFVGPGAAGRLTYKLGQTFGLAPKVAGTAATATGVAAGASMDAGEAAGEAFEGLMELPTELWEENPAYRELVGPLGEEEAKATLALEYTREAGAKAGLFSAATSAFPWARTVDKYLGKGTVDLEGNVLKRGLKGFVGESVQEGAVEGFNPVSVNQALQNVDPNQATFEGAGEGAALGAIGGGVFGGAAGLASPAPADQRPPVPDEDIDAELAALQEEDREYNRTIDEAAQAAADEAEANGGDALDAQVAATRVYNDNPQRKVMTAEDLGIKFDDADGGSNVGKSGRGSAEGSAEAQKPTDPIADAVDEARAFGDQEKVTRLENAQRMYQMGQTMMDAGNTAAAERMFDRADAVLESYDVIQAKTGMPATRALEGEYEQAEQVQGTEAPSVPRETYQNPPQPGPRRIGRENVIYGEEPADVTARRERFSRTNREAFEGSFPNDDTPDDTGGGGSFSNVNPTEEITDADYPAPPERGQNTFSDRDYPPPPERGENTFSDRDYPRLPSDPELSTGRPKGRSGPAPDSVEDEGGSYQSRASEVNMGKDRPPSAYNSGPFTVADMDAAGATPNVKDMFDSIDYQRSYKGRDIRVETMSPDDYLKRAAKGLESAGEQSAEEIIAGRARNTENIDGMVKEMQGGRKFAAPYLNYIGGSFGQEGMHRALAAKKMGMTEMPVVIMEDYADSVGDAEPEYGDFRIEQQQDGSLIVSGDPDAIRSRLPKALRGKVVDGGGGLQFARGRANDVREALRDSTDKPNNENKADKRQYSMDLEREERQRADASTLSQVEKDAVKRDAKAQGLPPHEIGGLISKARSMKADYPRSAGWAQLELAGLDKEGEPKWKKIPYAFNRPPGAKRAPARLDTEWAGKVVTKFTSMIEEIFERAENGDKNAQIIISHQTWYRNVAAALRAEYGAQGDLLADLLGATSPNEAVAQNWKSAIDILSRMWRGEFDREMSAFVKYMEEGGQISKFPDKDKIRKLSGVLYGINSASAQLAIGDMWRAVKSGTAPKARNFSLNLIGQSNMATIDVWAARMLRRVANSVRGAKLPRIPVPAEQGVSGLWNADVTGVTGEFGFGDYVMQQASEALAKKGIKISAPDLQAIAWFAEKELWTKNNWTSVAGEGGSFEQQIDGFPVERFLAGWSIQNGNKVPSRSATSTAQARVMSVLVGDDSVVTARVKPTTGTYAGETEESFDTEWVVKRGEHDPSMVMAEIARLAQESEQIDVFVSRALPPGEDSPGARPGVEIYFRNRQSLDEAMPIIERMMKGGLDGMTMAVDPRSKTGSGFIGVRLQYLPEIQVRYDEESRRTLLEEGGIEAATEDAMARMRAVANDIASTEGVAYSAVQMYETVVFGQEDYDAIIEGVPTGADQEGRAAARFGRPVREAVEGAVARAGGELREERGSGLSNAGTRLQQVESVSDLDPYDSAETRPRTTEKQRDTGRSALGSLEQSLTNRVEDGEVSILGARMYRNFRQGKPNQLLGQSVQSPWDLAFVAQVYRDPRFETFRYIAVKGGQVVGETAITSRLPGMVKLGPHAREDARSFVSSMTGAYGDVQIYMMHNHPSGISAPSREDRSFTRAISEVLGDSFAGHVVINTNEYTVIDADGSGDQVMAPELRSIDYKSDPEVPHDFINTLVAGPTQVGQMGVALARDDNYVLVMTGRADRQVSAITSVPAEYIDKGMQTKAGQRRLRAQLRRLARESGSAGFLFVVLPKGKTLSGASGLMPFVTDVIDARGRAMTDQEPGARPNLDALMFDESARAMKIEERLDGMPDTVMVDGKEVPFEDFEPAKKAAAQYAKSAGIDYTPTTQYAPLDRQRARKIAEEYERMEHAPQNPEVKAAYEAMIYETMAQYEAILDTGLEVEFIRGDDPYGNPRNAIIDVVENNHLWVFPTDDGFGSSADFDPSDNPLLQETRFTTAEGDTMLANDVFRVVHDYFGHIKNGVGFRARGEENAWQSHAAMYSPLARRAMTTETRGQNSWVNFGPNSSYNQTASGADTVYADQKVGLLPIWVSEEGRLSERNRQDDGRYTEGLEGAIGEGGRVQLTHFSARPIQRTNPRKASTGLDRKVAGRRYLPEVSYFGITQANEDGYRRETGLGQVSTGFSLPAASLYPADKNPEGLWIARNYPQSIENMKAAGFSGFWSNNSQMGKVAVVWDPLIADDVLEVNEEPGDYATTRPGYEINDSGMYSQLERKIAEANIPGLKPSKRNPEGSVRADSWLQHLRNRGIKQEEWAETGMRDLLNEDPRRRFTREELLREARERSTQVEDIASGDGAEASITAEEMGEAEWLSRASHDDLFRTFSAVAGGPGAATDLMGLFEAGDLELIEHQINVDGSPVDYYLIGHPRHGWAGFQDYEAQDFVFDGMSSLSEATVQISHYIRERSDGWSGASQNNAARWEEYVEHGDYGNYREIKITLPDVEGRFNSGAHFNEDNIVGFLRLTDRNDGEQLFIEELQSDWHQKGRELGYRPQVEKEAGRDRVTRAMDRADSAEADFRYAAQEKAVGRLVKDGVDEISAQLVMRDLANYVKSNSEIAAISRTAAETVVERYISDTARTTSSNDIAESLAGEAWALARAVEERTTAIIESRRAAKQPPDAPFKNDAWISLLAKRALVEAARGNYEAVGWMTSEAMSDRWSDEYAELYQNIYDKKLPALIGRMTGTTPRRSTEIPERAKAKSDEKYIAWRGMIRPISNYVRYDGEPTEDQIAEAIRRFKQDFYNESRPAQPVRVVGFDEAVKISPKWFGARSFWEVDLPADVAQRIASEGLPLFKADTKGRGSSVEDVRAWAGELELGVPYSVISKDQLPDHIKDMMKRDGLTSLSGWYTRGPGGGITLVADGIANKRAAQITLLHEAVGHMGVESVMGPRMDEFLTMVRDARSRDPRIDAVYQEVERDYTDAPDVVKAAEVVAYIAERNPRHNLVQRVVQWFREALRKMGFNVMLNNNDIIEVVRRARQSFQEQRAIDGAEGIVFRNEEAMALRPEQVKSAVANTGRFDPDAPGIMAKVDSRSSREAWRRENRTGRKQERVPEVQKAAEAYIAGEITQDEYIDAVRMNQPIEPISKVPVPATEQLMRYALKDSQAGKISTAKDTIPDGRRVGARLDIPAYDSYDVWVASIHEGEQTNSGSVLAYTPSAILTDVDFTTSPKAAAKIASGKASKATFARMHGSWKQHTPAQAAARAKRAMKSGDWVQVGMNPFRHSWFYDKATGNPVVAADEVIQVGALVMAKGVTYAEPSDPQFQIGNAGPMFRVGGAPSEPGLYAAPETAAATGIRWIQDRFKVLKDLQTDIREKGGTITNENNAYLAETLFHGKAEEDLRQMSERFVEPLANKMAEYGITSAELDEYLYAKHAPERNAHIASINPDMPDGGSGMTDREAGAVLARARAGGKREQLEQLSHIVQGMLQMQRDMVVQGGLEDDGTIEAWQSKYRNYVPLKGWAYDTRKQGRPAIGSGFAIRGNESKRAMGRKSKAASPLGYTMGDLSEKIIRARKNEVGNALLKLLEDNPDPESWEIYTDDNPETTRRIVKKRNPETGQIEETVVERPMAMAMQGDKYFTTKRNGKTYYMKIEDQRLVKAMKGMGPDSTGAFIRTLAGINRVLSALNTSYNPEFVVTNFARDVQTAILNLNAEQSMGLDSKTGGKKVAARTARDAVPAIRAIYASLSGRQLKGRRGAELQRYFQEFREAGAKTGYFDMKDLDGQAKDIDLLVTMAKGGFVGNTLKWGKAAAEVVENMNQAVENGVRLSAYMNAWKAGVPKPQAASLAKDMTVNFNRRGEIGTTLNALYMFANASVQGTANFARTMLTLSTKYHEDVDGNVTTTKGLNNAQKLAGAIMMGSYFLSMWARSVAGDDEDDVSWYDKVPDYVKERNIVIMKAGVGGEQDGTYWKIPLPYGYNVFHVMGSGIEAVTNGDKSPVDAATDLTLAIAGSFSPIGFQDSESIHGLFLKNAAPTVTKPFVDVAMNENFMGSSIFSENLPFGVQMPESSLGRPSTPALYDKLARFMNEVTGGSEYRTGAIDINPDVMRYFIDFYGGAAYGFLGSKVPDVVYRAATGQQVEQFRVPFVGRISGKVQPYADTSKFYDRRQEIGQIAAEFRNLPSNQRADFMKEFGNKMRLQGLVKSTEKKLQVQRKLRDRVYDQDLTPAQKDKRLREIQDQMKRISADFNRAYNEAEARAAGR